METDAELLQRFAAEADENAFRSLVERHSGMVYGVAWRIVEDATLAEEITQAVFTIFARKARSLAHKKLSGWLHDAAVLEARNYSRKAARYHRAVSAYQNEMTSSSSSESPWERMSPHLDEALSRLPERSKNMVIMRFYERLSFRQIAAAFEKSEEASRKEVDRAVQHLGTLLKKRGITTTGAALSVILGAQTLCVSPASAAALATASLQSIPLTTLPLLERASHWVSGVIGDKKMVAVALIALAPSAFLLAKNLRLEEQIRKLSHPAAPTVPVVVVQNQMARPVTPAVPEPPVNAQLQLPQHNEAKAVEQAKEQAALALTRIGLNLPDLSETQKTQIQDLIERRNREKLSAKMQAFGTGAVRRYALDPETVSEEEKALLYAMEAQEIPPAGDGQMQSILSADQFAEYVRMEEAKRVSNAEATAADVLKGVGRSIDLNPAQKDLIFESLARLELDGPQMTEQQQARPFGPRDATEDARDRIILSQLSRAQSEVYTKFRDGQKAGFTEFIKNSASKPGATNP